MIMDSVLIDIDSNVKNAETVKSAVIDVMVDNGIVSAEDADKFKHTHYVTVLKDSWFIKLCKVLNITDKDKYSYRVVKLVTDAEYEKYKESE